MNIGDRVIVYDGDLIGYTVAVLTKKAGFIEEDKLERWFMTTIDGTELLRLVRNDNDIQKDGSGYYLKGLNNEKHYD